MHGLRVGVVRELDVGEAVLDGVDAIVLLAYPWVAAVPAPVAHRIS